MYYCAYVCAIYTSIPKAIVAHTILRLLGFVNKVIISSLTSLSIQLLNISTNLNLGRDGAFGGSVKSCPKCTNSHNLPCVDNIR